MNFAHNCPDGVIHTQAHPKHPFYTHKPTPNTPFSGLNLKVGKMNHRLGNLDPSWAKCLNSGQNSVRGMSLRNITSLGSNLASVTDLQRIETPHSLCCDFGGYKPYNSLVRWQSSSLSQSLRPCLSSGNLSEGCSRRESKV